METMGLFIYFGLSLFISTCIFCLGGDFLAIFSLGFLGPTVFLLYICLISLLTYYWKKNKNIRQLLVVSLIAVSVMEAVFIFYIFYYIFS